jgi:hypothetical protein
MYVNKTWNSQRYFVRTTHNIFLSHQPSSTLNDAEGDVPRHLSFIGPSPWFLLF